MKAQRGSLVKKLYVGNLPWSIGDQELETRFSSYGSVRSARVITDRETGRARGFAFVEMSEASAADDVERQGGWERLHEAEAIVGHLGIAAPDRIVDTMVVVPCEGKAVMLLAGVEYMLEEIAERQEMLPNVERHCPISGDVAEY